MSTFKNDLYDICETISQEFAGWEFVSGKFKNKTLKHSTKVIDLGFLFDRATTFLQPTIEIINKRAEKLTKQLLGQGMATSTVDLQVVAHLLPHRGTELVESTLIVEDKELFSKVIREERSVMRGILSLAEAHKAIQDTIKDALFFMDNHYDFSSEDAFLKGLPPKYTTRHPNMPYREYEEKKAVELCIVHAMYGDFGFVEHYCSEEYKTIFPKRINELNKVLAALPSLKRCFDQTGKVI